MKKLSFAAGMLTAALIGGLGVTALAASGAMTITVDPINIQVNGQTFAPKDAQGNDVPVFALNGTTYAPLRALAEAYGLEVGYDQESNMATVGETTTPAPDTTAPSNDYSDWTAEEEAAYQEFKGMWEVDSHDSFYDTIINGTVRAHYATPNAEIDDGDLVGWFISQDAAELDAFCERMMWELYEQEDWMRLIFNGDRLNLWNTEISVFAGKTKATTNAAERQTYLIQK